MCAAGAMCVEANQVNWDPVCMIISGGIVLLSFDQQESGKARDYANIFCAMPVLPFVPIQEAMYGTV